MQTGLLSRSFDVDIEGMVLSVKAQRFCSMADVETAHMRYAIDVLAGEGTLELSARLDANVRNEDANWEEQFWNIESLSIQSEA